MVNEPLFFDAFDVRTTLPAASVVPVDEPVARPDHLPVTLTPDTGCPLLLTMVIVALADLPLAAVTRLIEMSLTLRTMARFGLTVMTTELELVPPRLSVTVSVAVNVPAFEYTFVGFAVDDDVPSPKFQA